MHNQPISVSPRTLCRGCGETPREEEGVHPRPKQPLQRRCQAHPADVHMCIPGRPDARVRPHRLYWDSACAPQARSGWNRVTAREPQVTRVCGSDLGGLCSACPGGRGWPGSGALPPLPASPCLCASGTEGLWGGQCGPGREVRAAGPGLVPKIANTRNHQGADTDANTRGFIYKLQHGSKYTRHCGAGTWTPRLRGDVAAL